ncbi:dienelactone hydrolase family protein [Alicyclobacillus shizuokensis]|uniref:dienelactone hydrolase family protein n=1 Tax=Alicyclobacillus shizuokensis TaxID=392014 RepID=UPI00082D180A|nr:dienelactone hydrolase family protein [Alicyclobacillus shizuokensis]
MGLDTRWVRYGADDRYMGYLAVQDHAQTPLPAVVVLQEVWGVDQHIEDVTERFAKAGYVAFAPDLYAVGGKRPEALHRDRVEAVKAFMEKLPPTAWGNPAERDAELAKLPGDEPQRVRETMTALFSGLDVDNYTDQLRATADFLRNQCQLSKGQSVVAVGYCLGGALAAHLASHDPELKGAVMYYGRSPKDERIAAIQCPVRAFYGELDAQLTATAPALAEAMSKAGKDFEYKVYPGAHHAFFNDTRRSYNVAASRDAFTRTLAYFNEWVG